MREIALVPAVLALSAALAGCGGGVVRATAEGPREAFGVEVWAGIEGVYAKGDYSPFPGEEAAKAKKKPRKRRGRRRRRGAEPLSPWQRRLQSATESLVDAIVAAREIGRDPSRRRKPGKDRLLEGQVSYDEVRELEPPAWRIQIRAKELVKTIEDRARERRIAALLAGLGAGSSPGTRPPGPGDAGVSEREPEAKSEEDKEFERLAPVAERIEVASTLFWRATAIHSKSGISESWRSLLVTCKGLPGVERMAEPAPEPETETTAGGEGELAPEAPDEPSPGGEPEPPEEERPETVE